MKIEDLLATSSFHIVGVPLIFVLIGVFANRLGRRDGDKAPSVNDWSVGTTTLLTALGAIAADLPNATPTGDFSSFAGWFSAVLLILFISIDNDRFRSWERNNLGIPTGRKHLWWGVMLPNLLSCAIFIAYQYSKLMNP